MTIKYNNVYINDKYTMLYTKYNKPLVKSFIDEQIKDYYMKEKTIEEAEKSFQIKSIKSLMNKNHLIESDISMLINSDLQNQNIASSFACSKYNIPSLNVYSACAAFTEELTIASKFVENTENKIIITTSSHNLVSEKQFRFPVEYGAIRKKVNGCTATGSISALVSCEKSSIKVESATIGKIITTSHKDANDMGSAMAPPAAVVIHDHLKETNRKSNYYDVILTGDLGEYGYKIMKEYYKKAYKEELNNVVDAGSIFYTENDIYAGASGPICLPIIFFDHILKNNKYKKILLVATGALHSVISSNLKLPMPGVAHAVSVEVL